jgi:MoxR-like ATPase
MHDQGIDPHDLAGVNPVANAADLAAGTLGVNDVRVTDEIVGYISTLARETRTNPALTLGVSPRGAAMLLRSAKAWAWLSGKDFVTPDDVKAILKPAWRHRLILRPEVELEGATSDSILDSVTGRVPVPA